MNQSVCLWNDSSTLSVEIQKPVVQGVPLLGCANIIRRGLVVLVGITGIFLLIAIFREGRMVGCTPVRGMSYGLLRLKLDRYQQASTFNSNIHRIS